MRLDADFEFTTPAILRGADQRHAELRVSGILGPLRSWWRASKIAKGPESGDGLAAREARLFGASGDEGRRTGQGAFVATLQPKDGNPKVIDVPEELRPLLVVHPKQMDRARGERNSPPTTKALAAGTAFRLTLHVNPAISDREASAFDAAEELRQTLKTMGLIGGIGNAARRGFGSLQLVRLATVDASGAELETALPRTAGDYEAALQVLLDRYAALPCAASVRHSHLCAGTEIAVSRYEGVNGTAAFARFAQQVSAAAGGLNLPDFPPGSLFSDSVVEVGANWEPLRERRPSPVVCHVHQTYEAAFVVLTYLAGRTLEPAASRRILDFLAKADCILSPRVAEQVP